MSSFKELLTLEITNAYENAYANAYGKFQSVSTTPKYSEPKIYDAGGDLSKRWYVYFSFRNPETGKMTRQTPVYGNANRYRTKAERMEILTMYRRSISDFLKRGLSPYEDNQSLLINKKIDSTVSESVATKNVVDKSLPVAEAFAMVLNIKKNAVSDATFVNYKSKLDNLQRWLQQLKNVATVDQITKKHIVSYLNEVLERTSARTRNNTRTELSSMFQALEDNELIANNFIKSINKLPTRPERHKTYTEKQLNAIYGYLEEEDPLLLLYVQFIALAFLRPIEVNRLRVKDVNLKERRLYVRAKNKPVKTKIIPEILLQHLPDLTEKAPDNWFFTHNGLGLPWDTEETNRRDYFSKRFSRKVKQRFSLGNDYGLYSFRHTYISKLYANMIKTSSPHQVKSDIMQITGHSSMKALEQYLRDIDAALPGDFSEHLK